MTKQETELPVQVDYRVIFDAASNGMAFTYASTGRIIDVNASWIRSTGIARQDAIGKTANELGIWASADEREACIAELERCGEVLNCEAQLMAREGEIPHLISGRIVDLDGEPCVLWEFRDIGYRKQVERQLQDANQGLESERRFLKTLIQTIPDLVWLKDTDGVYLACNPEFERFFGHPEKAIVGKTDYDFIPRDLAESFRDHDRAAMAAGQPTVNEEWITFASDGHRALLVTTKTPMHGADGRVIGVLGIAHDITELHASQEELKRHRNQLERIVDERTAELIAAHQKVLDTQFAMDKVGIGITWADTQSGRFLYANDYHASVLGYSPDELLQMRVSDIDPAFPAANFAQVVEDIRAQGVMQFETTQRKKNGQMVPAEMTVYHHAGTGETGARLIAFMTDITRRKEGENALLSAKKAAEAATVAKSAFLANMSHEIRTPMNAITGMVHIIRRAGISAEQGERLNKIESAGQHLLEIINAILDLSKIEAGKFTLEEAEVDLGAIVEMSPRFSTIRRKASTSKSSSTIN